MKSGETGLKDLRRIRQRIREKRESYARYNFSEAQHALLQTFFDLAQEYDSMEDFYRVCVVAPLEFLGVHSRLYLLGETSEELRLVCDSKMGLITPSRPVPVHVRRDFHAYEEKNSYCVPVHRKPAVEGENSSLPSKLVAGVLEVRPAKRLPEADRFFLRKYTNRIGYNLHNRLIGQQNIQHLKFINNLVADIEHNVITPNMYFKHLFNQLKKRIRDIEELESFFLTLKESKDRPDDASCQLVLGKVSALHAALAADHRALLEHHANYSLFLESLFRRDHFKQGHFVLRPTKCSIEKEIIAPQLEHYGSRLARRGVTVEQPRDMAGEEVFLRVDVGLLSQVYANFFSNAVKYAAEIVNHQGRPRKAMAYGREFLPNYFGPGKNGIKFNVFTTGEHLSAREAKMVYTEGFRGEKARPEPGTGHGLAFVKQVIEIHGGVAGYQATQEGNNFYFILPLSDLADESPADD